MYSGNEHLTCNGLETPFTMLDFWQWGYSNLLEGTLRGEFAEFIVKSAIALNGNDTNQGERWWHPYDLTGPGGLRLEVKCSAYLIDRAQAEPSKIQFQIAPTRFFNEYTDYSKESVRHSDVYVFCVWESKDRNESILDMDTWTFYVLSTKVLNDNLPEQKSISLQRLLDLNPMKSNFTGLRESIMREYADRGPLTFTFSKSPVTEP